MSIFASSSEVMHALKGVHFPTNQDKLLEHARSKGAPTEVVNLLELMPHQEYDTVIEVTKAMASVTEQVHEKYGRIKASASDVLTAVKGIKLPTDHDKLVAQATKNKASEAILETIGHLPNREYPTVIAIAKGLSEVASEPVAQHA